MQWHEVDSSVMTRVGYRRSSQTLQIHLRDGSTYEYDDVNPAAVNALLAAPSLGRHFNEFIVGTYAYRRVPRGGA